MSLTCEINSILLFGRGSAVKLGEEKDDCVNELMNYNSICRAAPGFAESAKYTCAALKPIRATMSSLTGSSISQLA